ncbi:NRDE family protein [Salinispirillum marinum]|uniref:NRDE family protein n=2 Tax=Saccharospirillaceae TaxID=255527 RepID=A0ABV8BG20_9GAMM
MCTLSWQHHQGTLNIVFSRDERRSRIAAEPPMVFNEGGREILAPHDPEGDGFWLATNDQGLTICLLNDYAAEQQHRTTMATQSRGRLVRSLSACATPMAVRSLLQNTAPMDFAPCVVFVFWQTQEPLCWRWSAQAWSETVAPSSPFSTSSLLPQWIPLLRRYFFSRWATELQGWRIWTPEHQLQAHCQRHGWMPWASVAMNRRDRATVSLTRIQVQPGLTRMEYWPGTPVPGAEPTSIQTLKTHWQPLPHSAPVVPPIAPPVDVERLLQDKNPTLWQRLRGWPLRLLLWITQVRQFNQALMALSDTNARRFPAQVLQRLGVSAQVLNGATLPTVAARPVFVANHPTGGLDGLILLAWLQSYYPEVKVVVTDLLTLIPPLQPLVVPVDRYRSSRQSVRNLHAAFATDAAILVFPAGRTARKQQGQLTDFEWHSMPVTLARRYGRSLVPIHLEGTNSWLFHGVAALRQRFNAALNLEMALLPRELLKPATRTFDVCVGETIRAEDLEQLAPNDQQRMAIVRAQYGRLARPHPALAQATSSLVLKETSS